jgi:hypothetical protein
MSDQNESEEITRRDQSVDKTKPFSAFVVPSQLEFRASDRKILIRNEDMSLQRFLSEARLRRHRSVFQEQQVQVAGSYDNQDFGK